MGIARRVDGDAVKPVYVIVGVVAAILLAGLVGQCQRRVGLADGKQLAHDSVTDVVNAARAAAVHDDSVAWQRKLDGLARAAVTPAQHAAAAERAIVASPDTLISKRVVLLALAAKDAVIAQDSAGIRERDSHILTLTRSLAVYTDSIVPALTRDRDRWKTEALRASSPCGAAATIGVGIRGIDAVAGFGCRIALPHLL